MKIEKQLIALGLFKTGRYIVDITKGEVISLIGKEAKIIKPIISNSGYYQITLDLGYNKRQCFYVHQLVYLWEYGTYNESFTIDHKDRIKLNNTIDNLKCGAHSNNIANTDRVYKNNHLKPRKTEQEKQEMVKLFEEGKSFSYIAKEYKCTRYNVSVIIRNRLGNVSATKFKVSCADKY